MGKTPKLISTGVIKFKEVLNWLVENTIGMQLKS